MLTTASRNLYVAATYCWQHVANCCTYKSQVVPSTSPPLSTSLSLSFSPAQPHQFLLPQVMSSQ